ncbi:MAG: efflux RND transporter permease subunit, partial [Actinomycetota bacterium]
MRWIVGSSLKFRRLIVALAVGLLIFGLSQLDDTPVEALPEFNPTVVEVQTEALGLSAREVEQLITVPLEQDLLNGVAFLDKIESASLPGLSSVVMTFDPGTPLLDARQVVGERLTQAHALPNVSKPPEMLQPLSSTARVSMIRLSSEELNPIELSVLARWVVVPRLLGVDGVANVSIFGQRDRELQVQVDPEELAEHDVSLQQVIATTGNALEFSPLTYLEASYPGTGGFIENLNQRLGIFHEQTISSPEELAEVPIEDYGGQPGVADGPPLLLGDVTEVVEDHQPLIGDARCQGTDCILLVVEKFPGANTIEVTNGLEDAIEVMQPGLGDVVMDASVYRPARFVERAVTNVSVALAVGATLMLLALLSLMRSVRAAVTAVTAIAVAAVAAIVVLRMQGASFNLMVLSGLVLA